MVFNFYWVVQQQNELDVAIDQRKVERHGESI